MKGAVVAMYSLKPAHGIFPKFYAHNLLYLWMCRIME